MNEILLRGGATTLDPRLDAVFDKDPRNKNFPVTMCMPDQVVHTSKAWPAGPVTDQGAEGACVGHGWTGCLLCDPKRLQISQVPDAYAFEYYKETQTRDDWEGEDYAGTSIKAGGETALSRGLITEYRWAFGLEEMLASVATLGPVVIAVPWYESMYDTNNGMVVVSGVMVGRHCLQVPQVDFEAREVEWQNSWGVGYGKAGRARVPFDMMDTLLKQEGEVLVPIYGPAVVESGPLNLYAASG